MANTYDYVRAFKRNCPRVAMTRADEDELARLFNVCRSEAREMGVAQALRERPSDG